MVVLAASFTSTVSAQKKVDPTGTWTYEATQAPYEYSTGDLVITKEAKEYSVKMVLGEYEAETEKEVYEKNVLTFVVYVDTEEVEIKMTVAKETMEGTASYSEGTIPITAKKNYSCKNQTGVSRSGLFFSEGRYAQANRNFLYCRLLC